MRLTLLMTVLAAAAIGCTSPSGPSESGDLLRGQTVSAVDGVARPGVSVQVGGARAVTTDANGYFAAPVGSVGDHETLVRDSGSVERLTVLNGPSGSVARLSLIPSTFDLVAFDEMFRSEAAGLQRWTRAPSLVVIASVMQYQSNAETFTATDERMTDEEVTRMIGDLTEGLSLLTGGTFTSFSAVEVERPESGEKRSTRRSGQIVVGRYRGIVSLAGTIGYGQWLIQEDGTVIGGSMYLDREFDKDDERRRLLRIHELGHTLGYRHVTSRISIMNPAVGPEPTDFDRVGAIIAFQRPPGNRSPDVDPAASPRTGGLGGAATWSRPMF